MLLGLIAILLLVVVIQQSVALAFSGGDKYFLDDQIFGTEI